ncbi:MAG: CoA pyrophosphatase [Roseovarius sp.]
MTRQAYAFDTALRERLGARLKRFVAERNDSAELRKAAVALILARSPQTGAASVIITLRPAGLRRHGAQYALPGGRLDAGETSLAAALRETSEELGLRLRDADILGRLDDFPTRSGFRIAPFVAWCDDVSALRPDPEEVESVTFIPLHELDSPEIPILEAEEEGGVPVLSAHLPVLGHRVYAPTAAILYQFREIALRGEITRVAHFGQPRFAWK